MLQSPFVGFGPALAEIDPRKFGLALVTCDGDTASAGDAHESFSIQSVSKVFTLTLALEKAGMALWERVGREPTGSAFNYIVQLEHEAGIPRNPLINAGAIVVTDELLADHTPEQTVEDIVAFLRTRADDPSVGIDLGVAWSEGDTGDRNASLAHFMRSFGNLKGRVGDVLHVCFRQCAIAMSCRQLARAGLYLAHAGTDPMTGERVISEVRTRRINAIMMSCGHCDASGEFAFQVGLPGKSGVGGGIIAVVPGRFTVCVWSPELNAAGNSLAGIAALEKLSERIGWSIF